MSINRFINWEANVLDAGVFFFLLSIATDKRGYPHNIFRISRQIHMLWVLIRSAPARRF